MQQALPIFTISCMFILWLTIFVALTWALSSGIRSRSWPFVNGEIITSETKKIRRSETGSILNHYKAVVQYKYNISDVEYTGSVISFSDLVWDSLNRGLLDEKSAKNIVRKYPAGTQVKVYVKPQKPKQAILEPGISDLKIILVFTIFIIMGIFMLTMLILNI